MISIVGSLVGCAATSGNYCSIAQPIYYDTVSDIEKTPASINRQVLEHNEKWSSLCRP